MFDPLRRAGEEPEEPAAPPAVEDEETEASEQAYSTVSADRRQKLMLELRFQTGNALALAYSYLVSVEVDPSAAIVMDFSGYEVKLAGRNLGPLFSALVAQRVAVVRERDDLQAEAESGRGATVVTRIDVASRARNAG